MGQKALIRLLIIFALVGVVALILKLTGPGKVETITATTEREKIFPDFPINDVARIRIKSITDELNLAKSDKGWVVAERDDYPADSQAAVAFLRDVWDLKIVQTPEIGPSQYGRLSLLDPAKGAEDTSATVVSFLDGEGKELAALWLGKVVERESGQPSPFGGPSTTEAGRYVKTGSEDAVHLVSETFSDIETDPAEWLDEDFFKVEKVKTIAIESGNEGEDWKLSREEENGDFTLAGAKEGEELDPVKVGSMKNAFSSPRFEDVVTGEEAQEKAPDKTTFVIETFDGFTYTVKLSEKTDLNEYYLTYDVSADLPDQRKPGEEESDEEKQKLDAEFAAAQQPLRDKLAREQAMAGKVYQVRSFVADSLIKKRDDLLKKDTPEDGAAGPTFTPGSAPPAGLENLGAIPGLPAGLSPEKPKPAKPPVAAPGAEGADNPKPEIEKPAPSTPPSEAPKADAPEKPEAKEAPKAPAKSESAPEPGSKEKEAPASEAKPAASEAPEN